MGQNTYVWIVLYENAPANSPKSVFVAAFASGDGTDPFGWSSTPATVTVPPGTVNGTTLTDHPGAPVQGIEPGDHHAAECAKQLRDPGNESRHTAGDGLRPFFNSPRRAMRDRSS